eukprot:c27449_g1_i3 orf=795-2246(-)
MSARSVLFVRSWKARAALGAAVATTIPKRLLLGKGAPLNMASRVFSTAQDRASTIGAASEEQILVEERPHTRIVILNRPQQLNALSYWMVEYLEQCYKYWEEDKNVHLVIMKGSGRAFCAGGDVAEVFHLGSGGLSVHLLLPCSSTTFLLRKSMLYLFIIIEDCLFQLSFDYIGDCYSLCKAGKFDESTRFFHKEYNMNYILGTYRKSHVALLDGIVMGGGNGISMHGNFRVATEKTVFAMPETALGLHPDVGASYFLSHLCGYLGEYLGLTGARLDGAELFASGLATHFVPSERLAELEKRLQNLNSGDLDIVNSAINEFSEKIKPKEGSPLYRLAQIDKCFSKNSMEEILNALEFEGAKVDDNWYEATLRALRKASPVSLKITLRSIREGRHQSLYDCLVREYRMTARCVFRKISTDFYEGCRAIVVDKDRNPKWDPATLELVTPAVVDHYFLPFETNTEELQLPARHFEQAATINPTPRL